MPDFILIVKYFIDSSLIDQKCAKFYKSNPYPAGTKNDEPLPLL